jgi:hypothetical protein
MDHAENTVSFLLLHNHGCEMCLPVHYLAMAALLLFDVGLVGKCLSIHLPANQSVHGTWKRYHQQVYVSHLLGCHATFSDNKNIRLFSENGYYFRMCDILMGTLHCRSRHGTTLQQLHMCQASFASWWSWMTATPEYLGWIGWSLLCCPGYVWLIVTAKA